MIITRYDNFVNGSIVEKFDRLCSKAKQPTLAVLNSNRLVIYATKATNFSEKIVAFFQGVISKFLFATGFLNTDPARIKVLQDSARNFYLEKAKKLALGHHESLKEMINGKEKKSTELDAKIQDLSGQHRLLVTKHAELATMVSDKENELKVLQEKEEKAHKLLKMNRDLNSKIETLKRKEQSLVKKVKDAAADLQPKEALIKDLTLQIAALKKEMSQLKNDSEQLKYKEQSEILQKKCDELEATNTTAYNNGYYDGKSAGYHEGHSAGVADGYGAGLAAGYSSGFANGQNAH